MNAQFARRIGGQSIPPADPSRVLDRAQRERAGWYHHLAAWTITAAVLSVIHLTGGNRDETRGLFTILGPWLVIPRIDFLWSCSYTIFPSYTPGGRSPSR